MVEAPGNEGGLFRSNDAGESWTLVNSSQRLRARPFYFHYVTVNPKNENEVWVNELGLHKSTDGGKTFTSGRDAARRQPRHVVQPRQPEHHPAGQRRRRQRQPQRRPQLVVDPQPADRRVLHGRGRRAVSVSPLHAAAGQQHADHPEHPAGVVGLRASGAGVAAGVGLRDRTDLAEEERQGGVGRVQGRSRPLQHRDRAGKALLGLSAEPLRPRSRTRSSTASRARPSSTCRRTTSASSTRPRTCCIARWTRASRGTSSAPT